MDNCWNNNRSVQGLTTIKQLLSPSKKKRKPKKKKKRGNLVKKIFSTKII